MDKFDIKILKICKCITLCIIFTLCFTGCSFDNPENDTTKEQVSNENNEEKTEYETKDRIGLSNFEMKDAHIYDITKAVCTNEYSDDDDVLLGAYALDDDCNIAIVLAHRVNYIVERYHVIGFNYDTGEYKKLRDDIIPVDENVYLTVVCARLNVYFDTVNSILYMDSGSYNLSNYGIVSVFDLNDKIYVFSENKRKFYLVKDNGQLEETCDIPSYLSDAYICATERLDHVVLSAYYSKDDKYVYMDVDPEKGILSMYTTSEFNEYFKEYEPGVYYDYNYLYDVTDTVKNTDENTDDNAGGDSDENNDDFEVGICLYKDDTKIFKTIPGYKDYKCYYEMDNDAHLSDGKFIILGKDKYDDVTEVLLWDGEGGIEYEYTENLKEPYEINIHSYDDVSKKAEEIGDKYGVNFIIGENVDKEYNEYKVLYCTDKEDIGYALELFDEVFSLYPEGFFDKLKYTDYYDINIYLTGEISQISEDMGISSAAAFVCEDLNAQTCVFDISNQWITKGTIAHEFTHVIDNKLYYDGVLDDDIWNTFNPEGFEYFYEYQDGNGNMSYYSDDGSYTYITNYFMEEDGDLSDVYFFDSYSKTLPTEDRARLMENLLEDDYEDSMFFVSDHIKEKLKYYFGLIEKDISIDESHVIWRERLNEFE